MLEELDRDIAEDKLNDSKWFTAQRSLDYPEFCRTALTAGTDDTLATALGVPGTFETHHQKKTPSGGVTTAVVPHTAPTTFAQGEFNRYYLRGLCARVIFERGGRIEIY